MSFSKAEQLLQLATLASSRRLGVTLEDISETFSVSHRTAQRMARALETQFPDVETHDGDDGRKRWRLARAQLRDLITISPEELAAMGLAATHFERTGMTGEAKALRSLEDKVMSLIPRTRARIEPDYEAILAAQGFVARPGPKPRIDEAVQGSLILDTSLTTHRKLPFEKLRHWGFCPACGAIWLLKILQAGVAPP